MQLLNIVCVGYFQDELLENQEKRTAKRVGN